MPEPRPATSATPAGVAVRESICVADQRSTVLGHKAREARPHSWLRSDAPRLNVVDCREAALASDRHSALEREGDPCLRPPARKRIKPRGRHARPEVVDIPQGDWDADQLSAFLAFSASSGRLHHG